MSSDSSLTTWIEGIKAGESQCALRLHLAIHDRLLRLARHSLGRPQRWIDEEDVALSAFHSFCNRAEQGKFDRLHSRDDLWRLLVRITYCKARDYVRKEKSQKRGRGLVRGESVFGSQDDPMAGRIDHVAGKQPTPEIALIVAEECQKLLAALGDETLVQIAIWKMEGFLDTEIAEKLGCVTRTVERKVNRIREKWTEFFESPRKLD